MKLPTIICTVAAVAALSLSALAQEQKQKEAQEKPLTVEQQAPSQDLEAKKARLRAMPIPSIEQASHYYGWTEEKIRNTFGTPVKVTTGGGKNNSEWKSLVYDDAKKGGTFFTFYNTGVMAGELSMLKGVLILPLKK